MFPAHPTYLFLGNIDGGRRGQGFVRDGNTSPYTDHRNAEVQAALAKGAFRVGLLGCEDSRPVPVPADPAGDRARQPINDLFWQPVDRVALWQEPRPLRMGSEEIFPSG